MRRGAVVRVDWPYSDRTGNKVRPAVVVQVDLLNSRIADTVLVLVSGTRRGTGPTEVLVDPVTEPRSGLRYLSAISCNNLLTIDQTLILQVIGSVRPRRCSASRPASRLPSAYPNFHFFLTPPPRFRYSARLLSLHGRPARQGMPPMPTAPPLVDHDLHLVTEADTLRAIIERKKNEIHEYVRRTLVLRNYAEALDASAVMAAARPAPLAAAATPAARVRRRAPAPVGRAGAGRRRRSRHLEALHDDPQFLVCCYLPAGWVRVRLKIHAPARGQIEFYGESPRRLRHALRCSASSASPTATPTRSSTSTSTGRRGPCAIDPTDHAGTFRIDRLEVTPRPAWTLAYDSLRRKLRLLRAYRNTGPVLRRGLALLLTGRWGTGRGQVEARA